MTDFQKTMEIIKWMMFNLKMETGSQSLAYYDVKSAIDTLKSKVGTYTGQFSPFCLLANVAGVDTVYILSREEDKTIIKHVDALLKLLSAMTNDNRYEKILAEAEGRAELIISMLISGKTPEQIAEFCKYRIKNMLTP